MKGLKCHAKIPVSKIHLQKVRKNKNQDGTHDCVIEAPPLFRNAKIHIKKGKVSIVWLHSLS